MIEVLNDKKVVTRKPHECIGCGEIFPKGTRMNLQTSVQDCGICSVYTCLDCERLMPYWDTSLEDGYPYGFARELMDDLEFEGSIKEFADHCEANEKKVD